MCAVCAVFLKLLFHRFKSFFNEKTDILSSIFPENSHKNVKILQKLLILKFYEKNCAHFVIFFIGD